jgi:heme-degrading monooxygenase HmoA
VIARIWRGWTSQSDRDEYLRFLRKIDIPSITAKEGNLGVHMLNRNLDDGRTEFVLLSFWDSMESVRAWAGDEPERAVFFPDELRFLTDREESATHYEVR